MAFVETFSKSGMAFTDDFHGDVFPLPCRSFVESVPGKDLSRKVRQRVLRRIRSQQDERDMIAASSELMTGSAAIGAGTPSAAQRSALGCIKSACTGTRSHDASILPKAALQALLGTDSLHFNGSVGQLAPHVKDSVSFPSLKVVVCIVF